MIPILLVGAAYLIGKTIKEESFKEGGEVPLLAPNGKPSKLTPEQWQLVRTLAFKKWFGDWENDAENASKVVDENGEPLVVYRGNLVNQEQLGYTFNLGENFLKKQSGNTFGFFFTNKIDIAKKYMLVDHFDEIRGGSLTEVFIKSNKILDLKDFDLKISQNIFVEGLIQKGIIFDNELEKRILDFDSDTYEYWGNNVFDYFDVFPELRNLFIKNGFTSVVFYEMSRNYSKYQVYVAFNSNQIKLADGTNITFDGSNPDIRYEEGGDVEVERFENDGRLGEYYVPKILQDALNSNPKIVMSTFNDDTNAIQLKIPVNLPKGVEPTNAYSVTKKDLSKKITEPIEVIYNPETGEWNLLDGNHRLAQALANGEKEILANVCIVADPMDGSKEPIDFLENRELTSFK